MQQQHSAARQKPSKTIQQQPPKTKKQTKTNNLTVEAPAIGNVASDRHSTLRPNIEMQAQSDTIDRYVRATRNIGAVDDHSSGQVEARCGEVVTHCAQRRRRRRLTTAITAVGE